MRGMLYLSVVLMVMIVKSVFAADLSADEIRNTITGKTIFLETRFGIEFPLSYKANGDVTGDGRGTGLGQYFAPKETGKWWLKDNKLCQQFPTWNNGEVRCFKLESTGSKSLIWKQDNGRSGRARIG